jgi:hypothetical protein
MVEVLRKSSSASPRSQLPAFSRTVSRPLSKLISTSPRSNVKMIFTPDNRKSPVVELTREVNFLPARNVWSSSLGAGPVSRGFVLVDTDGSGIADTNMPGASANFAAGVRVDGSLAKPLTTAEYLNLSPGDQVIAAACHPTDVSQHCPDGELLPYIY